MRWLIIAILLVVAAWGMSVGEYEIFIYGTADGFRIVYRWISSGYGTSGNHFFDWKDGEVYHYATATFYVDSLDEVRPTPAEMEGR